MTVVKNLAALREKAKDLDKKWEPILGGYNREFHQNTERDYFSGNSLGLQPSGFLEKLRHHANIWKYKQHDGHFECDGEHDRPWWKYEEKSASIIADLAGSYQHEVAICNSLSTNNRNVLESCLMYIRDHLRKETTSTPTFISVQENFPSDFVGLRYSLAVVFGDNYKLIEVPSEPNGSHNFMRIIETIKQNSGISLGFFPSLCFITGQRFPIKQITAALHEIGALSGFDLAHSLGNHELELHKDEVDFATFCSYKYLCGGPGGVGGLYAHEKLLARAGFKTVSGWFGIHPDDRFRFNPSTYRPAEGARSFIQSNAPIFNMLGLEAYCDLVQKYGKSTIGEKHREISTFMHDCLSTIPGIQIITPQKWEDRGCQISFSSIGKERDSVYQELLKKSFCEERGQNVIRVAPVGYNRFEQCAKFASYLHEIIAS